MHIGITGSRTEPTTFQLYQLRLQLIKLNPTTIHHGDCIGADAAAHDIALSLGIRVVIHPPQSKEFRAFCKGAAKIYPPLPFLRRDRNIVHHTKKLLALPRALEDERSGTWYTIRFARQLEKPVWICYPEAVDGI